MTAIRKNTSSEADVCSMAIVSYELLLGVSTTRDGYSGDLSQCFF